MQNYKLKLSPIHAIEFQSDSSWIGMLSPKVILRQKWIFIRIFARRIFANGKHTSLFTLIDFDARFKSAFDHPTPDILGLPTKFVVSMNIFVISHTKITTEK